MTVTTETQPSSRIIQVDALARVEGEGALYVRVKDDLVQDVKFRIYEPPRFFEALLKGRPANDAVDITARICGICPIAYVSGVQNAMEMALGIDLTEGPIRDLRRLLYCGEWIQSHVLHTYMLHAPDFLGLEDSIQIAHRHPGVVERALKMKRLGNKIMEAIGGRSTHPINLKVGGFYRAPTTAEIRALIDPLKAAIEDAVATIRLFATFDYPDYEDDYIYAAIHREDEYGIDQGSIKNNRGLEIPVTEFHEHYTEEHVAHSTSKRGLYQDTDGDPAYLLGPLARFTINYDQLSPLCKQMAEEVGIAGGTNNNFKSLLVRAIETLYAYEEALRLAEAYEELTEPSVKVTPKAGIGAGATEAPRGICFHRYELDSEGRIVSADIRAPTGQSQRVIENDLRGVVQKNLHLDEAALTWRCEQTIRNYDPCISCSCHFLKLQIERE